MAHGFRHVPRERKAQPPDDHPRCPWCHARLDLGGRVQSLYIAEIMAGARAHLCKEVAYGTSAPPLAFIPFDPLP